ncbi:preprotein translocase subunit YajC [Exiguobacterium sp. SH3S2]|uniref:preprotein translocase subunit YajC n=1 Tax=Exiguobacterium TaxID=33986 RepID=UPI000877A2BA|nr:MULTISPECIES: preprotein translocase subunit YajC [Exiguobacterium]OGX78157.1 preprotein translocase subunit YajC [Exiguobacterium sp. SH31]TCI26589.1 preprotein translocase subunit YajC [Exiguobacterium sp. SH5S4]TCI37553.1 preprotein translocase subunit YajC [Exiguobacterium sp. SH4S7]TCI43317.1 preprotein translocase subunit YajC [Exiguobacterium sp. SH3S3]TCI45885.1 preprotein translocase subunit YajC [Exiguobacterium sp. SH5S32]
METLVALLPMILIFVVFYFLLIRPQTKRQKQVQTMQNALERGDHVVTIGGLHGVVHQIEDTEVTLKCDQALLKFNRSAIAEVTKKGNSSFAE